MRPMALSMTQKSFKQQFFFINEVLKASIKQAHAWELEMKPPHRQAPTKHKLPGHSPSVLAEAAPPYASVAATSVFA